MSETTALNALNTLGEWLLRKSLFKKFTLKNNYIKRYLLEYIYAMKFYTNILMKITNIVCSGSLNQTVPLGAISVSDLDYFHYDPEMYHGGYIKLHCGKATIYSSGKYILAGLKDFSEINRSFKELLDKLGSFIDISSATPPIIRNIVALDDYGLSVDLYSIYKNFQNVNIVYDPDHFPGIIIRLKDLTSLVFSSGKIIYTGSNNMDSLKKGRDSVLNMVSKSQ